MKIWAKVWTKIKHLWNNLVHKIKHIPKRKQAILAIVTGLVIIGIAFLIWAIVTGRIRPFAAGNQISNTATVTYQDASGSHTVTSNTVLTDLLSSPNAPSGLVATAASSTQINLSWTDNSADESGFKIERATPACTNSFSQVALAGQNATTFSDTGLTAATDYCYRVKSVNAAGDSAASNQASATTQAGANPTINISFTLQAGTNFSTTGTVLTIYNTGTSTKVFEKTDVTTNTTGNATITITALASGNYDYFLKANGYLAKAIRNTPFANPLNLSFGALKAGDLDGDNYVTLSDFIAFKAHWLQSDPISDFDHDGTVTLSDFLTLRANWLQQGDK